MTSINVRIKSESNKFEEICNGFNSLYDAILMATQISKQKEDELVVREPETEEERTTPPEKKGKNKVVSWVIIAN